MSTSTADARPCALACCAPRDGAGPRMTHAPNRTVPIRPRDQSTGQLVTSTVRTSWAALVHNDDVSAFGSDTRVVSAWQKGRIDSGQLVAMLPDPSGPRRPTAGRAVTGSVKTGESGRRKPAEVVVRNPAVVGGDREKPRICSSR